MSYRSSERRFRHPPGGSSRNLEDEIAAACRNDESVDSIRGRTRLLNLLRDDAREAHGDFADWRDRARAIKERSIDRLPVLMESVREALRSRNQSMYLARDAADANRYITRLCRRRAVESAVKSKSMTTEEIELNDALEEHGITVTETDLGEYVAQMANERPSHIIGPIIHKSETAVADVFRRHVDGSLTEDVDAETLTNLSREQLRERFLEADMGITGANFVVAETGSIALVTNEGNARWTMQAPPIHVAVAGIEKLIPTVEDLQPFYELLPKSGTGQPTTAYFSLITPPTPDERIDYRTGETGPPREFHLVLIDNGRRAMARDPQLREALYCIRCGACLNACANYQVVGGHVYGGETYAGGIGNAWEAGVTGRDEAEAFNDLCTGCSQCKPACPVKIDIPWMNTVVRDRLNRDLEREDIEGFVFEEARPEAGGGSLQKRFFGGFERMVPWIAPFVPPARWILDRPPFRRVLASLVGFARDRPVPRVHPRPYTDRSECPGPGDEGPVLLADRYSNYLHPERLEAAVDLLRASGAAVSVIDAGPSGRDALSQGFVDRAAREAESLYDRVAGILGNGRDLLVLEPSVAALLEDEYGRLLNGPRHARLRDGVRTVGDFLLERLEEGQLEVDLEDRSFFLHGHCQQRASDQFEPIHQLLERAGADLTVSGVECCGMAGSFGYKKQYHELAVKVAEPLCASIEEDGSGTVLATGTSCTAQIEDQTGRDVLHPVEVLREALPSTEAG